MLREPQPARARRPAGGPRHMPDRRASYAFHDLRPAADDFLADVIAGLGSEPKVLAPKYFYDRRGSALFEAICETPEYYLTRSELALTQRHAREMARCIGPGCVLIEYGSGSGRKTRILLGALEPRAYVPIDISAAQLRAASEALAREFPGLSIVAVCADYSRPLAVPGLDAAPGARRAIYFPGSTIGNFTPEEAVAFLAGARALAGPGGAMLVGVDLKKDAARLDAAYNDAQGLTAAFNLNLLERINHELGADFDLAAFAHRAFYDAALGRIEMHLESLREQQVRVAGRVFRFRRGETIHTENSYKYTVAEFRDLAREAGWEPRECWTDEAGLFSVHGLAAPR